MNEMCALIRAQSTAFSDEDVMEMIRKAYSSERMDALELVYYPYYFVSYVMHLKKFWKSYTCQLSITIDSVSGVCSLADHSLSTEMVEVSENQIVPCEMTETEAIDAAHSFLKKNVLLNLKFTAPEFHIEHCQSFYRPYWVVKNDRNDERTDPIQMIVDAVTGKYYLS